jgi:hypothetical protein
MNALGPGDGDIVIEKVNGGYVVSVLVGSGGLVERHVAKAGDGGTDLLNLIKTLLVTEAVKR